MASGHVNRIKRPNTWLHRPMLQNVKKALANSEPSTHGTVEGRVGVGEKRPTIRRIVRIERDADTRRDAVGLRRIACRAQRFQNGFGKPACRGGIGNSGHQNGELVAPQTRHHLTLVEHCGNA
jgi:hypothetical protein